MKQKQATLLRQKTPVILISACGKPTFGKSIIATFLQGWEQCLVIFQHGNGQSFIAVKGGHFMHYSQFIGKVSLPSSAQNNVQQSDNFRTILHISGQFNCCPDIVSE